MAVGLTHYLVLSAILFCIGLVGVITKRNAIIILMCIEIMLNAVNITFVAFSRYITPEFLTGQLFAMFVMAVAAAEAAVGIAVIITVYRNRETIDVDKFNIFKH
jgi:NAD(P)H-quinone oxidoreductase subunit 4L